MAPAEASAGHGHDDRPYAPVFPAGSPGRAELDALLERYPTKMAALLPALWIVQRARGYVGPTR
jgi:NADH:ubiquinone oxidoreductase subunit E